MCAEAFIVGAGADMTTADTVTKWMQSHPLLHTEQEGPGTPPAGDCYLMQTHAEAQLAQLQPFLDSLAAEQ